MENLSQNHIQNTLDIFSTSEYLCPKSNIDFTLKFVENSDVYQLQYTTERLREVQKEALFLVENECQLKRVLETDVSALGLWCFDTKGHFLVQKHLSILPKIPANFRAYTLCRTKEWQTLQKSTAFQKTSLLLIDF